MSTKSAIVFVQARGLPYKGNNFSGMIIAQQAFPVGLPMVQTLAALFQTGFEYLESVSLKQTVQ